MVINIDTLTDKIYQEGIEKAEHEASEIINNARIKAEKIINEAQKKAEKMIEEAEEKAEELKQNSLADIRLAGNKSILLLKNEIKDLIKTNVLEQNFKKAFEDVEFLQSVIKEIINLSPVEIDQLTLPEKLKNNIQESFTKSVGKTLKNLTITFSNKIEGGFQISEKGTGYFITFTEKDFVAFFSSILNETTKNILFNGTK